ncbi:MAG: hypothetical protein IPG90_14290 [Bacteroidetes bacterium]|nr:hypothetical protein [Bacteroidota bacterium]
MSKILISWSAFNNDFTWLYRGTINEQKDKVKENGPTFTVHKFFGDEYDKHILLNSSSEQKDKNFLTNLSVRLKKNSNMLLYPDKL